MRTILFLLLLSFSITGCRPDTLHPKARQQQTIVIQPLGPTNLQDKQQLSFLQKQITDFFKIRTVIHSSIPLPAAFINMEKGRRYCADSILKLLAAKQSDTILTTIGITHEDIYTTKYDSNGQVKAPAYKYKVWGIFGLGYRPGRACVLSDYRLHTNDDKKFAHRLRTVALHEIGHNKGLPHCPVAGCIMSGADEKISTIDNSGMDYCTSCKNSKPISRR